ncbi:OLC1v1000382C2 [Oldenlandia corymbosa var. corymbosa]|nr:OLC1v1000382C2 [Oldenlandia corymbosa var. corymbosa]
MRTHADASRSHEANDAGVRSFPGVESNIGTLTNAVTTLLGAVEYISLQLNEVSYTVNGIVNNGKNLDSTCGKSTSGGVMYVDSKRDIVGEFHHLKQTANVAEYQEKFDELKALMVKMDYGLSQGYLISSFLSGLKPEIKLSIGNRKQETLYHAFNLARIEEIKIEVLKAKLMSLDGNEEKVLSGVFWS